MGWPVGHSLSPVLYKYWLRENATKGDYRLLEVSPDNLAAEITALAEKGFAGVNVTIPHKEAALAAILRRPANQVEETARRIGAVNAITVRPDGSLFARNTDGIGFIENLKSEVSGWRADAGPAVVLGAGGAARAVVAALIGGGAPEIRLANRTAARASQLVRELTVAPSGPGGGKIDVVAWDRRQDALRDAALLVNTTSLGMVGNPSLVLDLDGLPFEAVVNDIVYRPLETDLLKVARLRGNPVAGGLGMLIHQARPCFEEWFGGKAEITPGLIRALLAKLKG